jgi:predicted membrane-bound spermidine synthase
MLGFYLVGIAFGSFAARGLSKKNDSRGVLKAAASAVLFGSIASYLLGPVLARAIHYLPYQSTLVLVFACASMLGSAFPLLAHAAIDPDDETGQKLSFLYLSNIIGSTLGSFLVGFLLLNTWSTSATSALLLGLGLAAYAALGYLARPAIKTFAMVTGCVVCTALAVASRPIYSGLYERLLAKDSQPGPPFANLVENRSGVIAVTNDGIVYGGGAYDGRFNTNLVHDTNALFRAFAVAGMHPHPAKMLVIGLSSGSWAQVVANDPAVKDITVVEINPGYLPLIDERSSVRSLRSNPKVHIVIDDGRRWLTSHSDEKFDFILCNSTFYWRANASNLLSREFLQLLRRHLAPDGIAYYNTTWSPRVVATAVAVFPYTMRFANFMAVSDSPFTLDKDRWREVLTQYRIDGKPVLDLTKPEDRARLDQLMDFANPGGSGSVLEMGDRLARDVQQVPIITDDNMGSEWELGR